MKTPEEMAEKYAEDKSKAYYMDKYGCQTWYMTERGRYSKEDFLAGYAAAQPKWISVKERLPKVLESVLVVYAPTNEAKNDHRMECWNWPETEVYEKKFITHWMPLPEPPKENE